MVSEMVREMFMHSGSPKERENESFLQQLKRSSTSIRQAFAKDFQYRETTQIYETNAPMF